MPKQPESVGLVSLEETLSKCSGSSCGFCRFCMNKNQKRYVTRKDGTKSYYPWQGTCHRYPPTVLADKNGTPFYVYPKVYLTDTCGEYQINR